MYSDQILESSKFIEVIIKQRKKERTRSEGREKTVFSHELSTAKRKQRRVKSVNETTSGEKQQKKRHARRAARSAQFRDRFNGGLLASNYKCDEYTYAEVAQVVMADFWPTFFLTNHFLWFFEICRQTADSFFFHKKMDFFFYRRTPFFFL